jgi:predicted PolB exonuclease-like 3'-5' exonuclease
MAFQLRRRAGHDFLPLHMQKVVAISCVLRDKNDFALSLGEVSGRPHSPFLRWHR